MGRNPQYDTDLQLEMDSRFHQIKHDGYFNNNNNLSTQMYADLVAKAQNVVDAYTGTSLYRDQYAQVDWDGKKYSIPKNELTMFNQLAGQLRAQQQIQTQQLGTVGQNNIVIGYNGYSGIDTYASSVKDTHVGNTVATCTTINNVQKYAEPVIQTVVQERKKINHNIEDVVSQTHHISIFKKLKKFL